MDYWRQREKGNKKGNRNTYRDDSTRRNGALNALLAEQIPTERERVFQIFYVINAKLVEIQPDT